jgi:hypothetical protein
MSEGFHPLKDPFNEDWPMDSFSSRMAGKPICDGKFVAVVWGIACDAEYAANELKLPHWQKVDNNCIWCPAAKNKNDLKNFELTAEWKQNLYNGIDHNTPPSTHQVWQIPGVNRFTYTGDWMHGCDLGPAVYLHCSVLNDFAEADGIFGGAGQLPRRLIRIWDCLQESYEA